MFSWQVYNKICNKIAHFCLFVTQFTFGEHLFNAGKNQQGKLTHDQHKITSKCVHIDFSSASVINIFHLELVTKHCWTFPAKVKLTESVSLVKKKKKSLNQYGFDTTFPFSVLIFNFVFYCIFHSVFPSSPPFSNTRKSLESEHILLWLIRQQHCTCTHQRWKIGLHRADLQETKTVPHRQDI